MFKKRFGVTPSEWRQKNVVKKSPSPPKRQIARLAARVGIVLAMLGLNFILPAFAQSNPPAEVSKIRDVTRLVTNLRMAELTGEKYQTDVPMPVPTNTVSPTVATNAKLGFKVEKYLVMGNSILLPEEIGRIFTNVPSAFGTNVTFDEVRAQLSNLQTAYRERGFVTVSVGLPQQKLTNATVKVKVTEGRLAAINVMDNRHFSEENVRARAAELAYEHAPQLPRFSTRTRHRQRQPRPARFIPSSAPAPEPETSALTLKVKDRLPWHARVEVNNQATPGTPQLRANFNTQYNNLWDLEHQVGLQYSFTFEQFKSGHDYQSTLFDAPLVANYSAYYRLPLGTYRSVQQQLDDQPRSFGYNEITHKFILPPPTGRPDLTFYASRSTTDTGIQLGQQSIVSQTPLLIISSQDSGENFTLNENLGTRLSLPLPALAGISSTLSLGLDFKRYRLVSYNTNNFPTTIVTTNQDGTPRFINFTTSSGQPTQRALVDYLPFNAGLSGSIPDKLGTTFFNANANFNVLSILSKDADFARASYTTKAHAQYVTLQMGADREQKIHGDWSVRLHADGQWADGPLFSNEQFALGGTAGVRGYTDGEAYGDSGWRVMMSRARRWSMSAWWMATNLYGFMGRYSWIMANSIGSTPRRDRFVIACNFGGRAAALPPVLEVIWTAGSRLRGRYWPPRKHPLVVFTFILASGFSSKLMLSNFSPIRNARWQVGLPKLGNCFSPITIMRSLQCNPVFRQFVAGMLMFGIALNAVANPEGMTVTSGSATAQQNGAQLTITASQNAFINWQSFNLAPGETTTFQQPSAASIVWNRINDPNPSQIWGHINANGVVVLMNQSGFFFGPGSVVNAAGFVATTATMLPESGIGGIWQFNGPPPVASIVNYGEVKVNSGGSIFAEEN